MGCLLALCRAPQLCQASCQHGRERVDKIAEQVKAIKHLDSLRCPFPNSISELAGAISTDQTDRGMHFQPAGDSGGLPIRQEVENLMALEIDNDCAEPLSAAE